MNHYITPSGESFTLFDELLSGYHTMIAGATGSGKSVVINGILSRLMYDFPDETGLILIDPKKVELFRYSSLPHVLFYADEIDSIAAGLKKAVIVMMQRYAQMQAAGERKSRRGKIFIIIDEFASLVGQRGIRDSLRQIAELGRAANIFLILATQRPTADVIDKRIAVNVDTRLALRTATAQDSRNIIGANGAERLPRFGAGLLSSPDHLEPVRVAVPLIDDAELDRLINHWMKQALTA